MASAKYTILIPTHDELGQPLVLAQAAHHYLAQGNVPIVAATVHPGTPFNALTVWAEDAPKIDGAMKQLGDYVAEIANMPNCTVTKSGKNTATWQLANRHYLPGVGAEQAALSSRGTSHTDKPPGSQDSGLESPDFPPRIPDNIDNGNSYPSGFSPMKPDPQSIS